MIKHSLKYITVFVCFLSLSGCEYFDEWTAYPTAPIANEITTSTSELEPTGAILKKGDQIPDFLLSPATKIEEGAQIGQFKSTSPKSMIDKEGRFEASIQSRELTEDLFIKKEEGDKIQFIKLEKGEIAKYELIISDLQTGATKKIDEFNLNGLNLEISPFGLIGFTKKSRYFEYYTQATQSNRFKMYDLINEKQIAIRPSGYIDRRFWYGDYLLICSHAGPYKGVESSVAVAKGNEFLLENQYFIHPEGINQFRQNEANVIQQLSNRENRRSSQPKNCRIESDQLLFEVEGKTKAFNLDKLPTLNF